MARGSLAMLSCLLVAVIGSAHADAPEALVGGQYVTGNEFPYLVSIRNQGELHCGGAIISEYFILTAAHCVLPLLSIPMNQVTVVTSTNHLNIGGEVHKVAAYIPHPEYDERDTWFNDIGLIKLAQPIRFSATQQPIRLPTSPPPVNTYATIAAWGATEVPLRSVSSRLKKVDLKMIPRTDCQSYYHDTTIVDKQICTLNQKDVGTCAGDSGSPLACRGVLVGVVSGGIPCALGLPDVFTNVYAYLDFIKRSMSL
ncbi:hypothetical protein KPH14_006798 [Odynerus spinipes]|uniref:Peptidase S1 domain-containing protein n=1 Tax=Odynerus spinipes TaxID=1348599 RepID=A0AAD9VRP3_9HYME|nr:hypothetical protein KPH14_006798 [Odynerus spinipes]